MQKNNKNSSNNNHSSSPPKNRSSSTQNLGHHKSNNHSTKDLDPLNLLGNKRGGSPGKGARSSVLFPSANQNARARSPSPTAGRLGSPLPEDRVKKNAKGGVLITPEEIQNAFSILDLEKTGQLNIGTLKKRLGLLFPDMTAKEYRFLMNNKKEITIEDLKELLLENELAHFDPVADAFKVFDPEGKGILNEDKLRQAFISFGLGELSDEELDILKRSADLNADGSISLDDFRDMLEGNANQKKPPAVEKAGSSLSKFM